MLLILNMFRIKANNFDMNYKVLHNLAPLPTWQHQPTGSLFDLAALH